jgi:uncharacterized protein HemX
MGSPKEHSGPARFAGSKEITKMDTERTTTTHDANGTSHTTTHVVHEANSGGGAAKWAFLAVLAVALGIGAFLLSQGNVAEVAKDNAIAEAAGDVGEAAGQVGEAAQNAGAAAQDIANDANVAR